MKLTTLEEETPLGEGGEVGWTAGELAGVCTKVSGGGGGAREGEGGGLGAMAIVALLLLAITTTIRDSFFRQFSWFPLMK